jgi:excisionase family DNA binding protein
MDTKQVQQNVDDFRLSVSEAAKLFGVDQITIRRALKEGGIRYIVVRNRYKISFASLLKWSQTKTTVKNKLANKGIGQFVDTWKINNTLYSPRPKSG